MKLEEGMYVRTKKGKIYKFETNNSMAKNGAKKYMVNCSYNLIDLIQVGDYINGKKVVNKQYHYTDKDNYDMGEWCIFYENVALGDYQYDIKSIVTKEAFESISYEVE